MTIYSTPIEQQLKEAQRESQRLLSDTQQITYSIEANTISTYLHGLYVGSARLPDDAKVCRWQEGADNE